MNYPITRTKVILPRRHQDLLSRPRLLELLDDLLEYRLTLVTAPAGYGKTTLLVDLADQVDYPVCWLAIDALDEDPLRFLHYFVAAVRQSFPGFGAASSSLLVEQEGGELDEEQILHTVVNDLYDHVQEHFALVLDDYHLVDHSPEVNRFVNDFAQAVDENCHLVIASRSLISLPDLPLMVGRSDVKGLSFDELAFLPEEIRDLYRVKYRQEVSSQEAEELARQSEGWITGLLLTAESTRRGATAQDRAIKAAGIDLYDYLAQQVLSQQSPAMQDFLLRTSLLEEFNERLCRQALGEHEEGQSWKELIGELLESNLFIQPVENGGTWLRYHHLFRDFLQHRYQDLDPAGCQELLRRLVDVYQDNQSLEKAYAACQRIGDEALTADFIQRVSPTLIHSGRLSLAKAWIDALPREQVDMNPALLAYRAAIANLTGDMAASLRTLDQALKRSRPFEDPALEAQLLVRRATCRRMLGNYPAGLEDAQRALELVKEVEQAAVLSAEVEHELGLIQQRMGASQPARENLEKSLAGYLERGDHQNAAYVQLDLGLLEMNTGQFDAAKSLYHQAYQRYQELGNLSQLMVLSNNLGVLDHLTGSYLGAFDWFKKGLEYARQTSNQRATAYTLASLADLAIDLGALTPAETYIRESWEIAEEIGESFLLTYLTRARAALARRRGDLASARESLQEAAFRIGGGSRALEEGDLHLERGWLLSEEGEQEQAVREFRAARQIFSESKHSVEEALALLALAGAACRRQKGSEAARVLDSFRQITRILGTLKPFIPILSSEKDLLACLGTHLGEDPLIRALVREVEVFRSQLPELLETLAARRLPIETRRQPSLEIQALGRMAVKQRGEAIEAPEWTTQRAVRELFFYLLSCPEGASREEICLEFWPESDQSRLQKQFKNTVYRLRRAVGKEVILYDPTSRLYSFNRGLDYRYDVEEFQRAVEAAEGERDPLSRTRLLESAAELYQDPFAPGAEGTWVGPLRYQLYLDYERVSLEAARGQLEAGRPEACLARVEQLLEVTPGQEEAWRLAMRAYGLKSDRAGVERTYRRCRTALAADLDADPSPETESLYRQLMA